LVNKNILSNIFHSNKEFNSIAKLWASIDWPTHNNGEGEDEETLDFINQQNANFVFDNSKSKLKVLFYIFIFKVNSKILIFCPREI